MFFVSLIEVRDLLVERAAKGTNDSLGIPKLLVPHIHGNSKGYAGAHGVNANISTRGYLSHTCLHLLVWRKPPRGNW